jgi:hypothetical protein
MIILLKIIHMFSLYVGGAAGIGNGLLLSKTLKSGQPPSPVVAQVMGLIGKMGFVAIILLWLSGIGMITLNNAWSTLGWAFWVKLVGASLVLVAASSMTVIAVKAEKAGVPPNPWLIKKFSYLAHVGLPVAVIFAVIAFA